MNQVVKLNPLIGRTTDNSGKRILESLVNIAEHADAQFTYEMLNSFWKPFEGHYQRFIETYLLIWG